jgi:Cu+-exporting ATPase
VYTFFLHDEEAALLIGVSTFIALFPICLWLSEALVLQFAKNVLANTEIKVNNKRALKKITEVDTVAMPMNRFLTNGEYFITDLFPDGISQNELLSYAASVEQYSEHTFGRLIYKTALGRGLKVYNVTAAQEIPCCGAEALLEKKALRIGNPQWIQDQGVTISNVLLTKIDQLAVHGKTPLVFSLGLMARGIVALKDEVNPASKSFIQILKNNSLDPVLLTAANSRTAKNFAKDMKIDTVRSELSPDDKAREVQILRAKKQNVAMLGNEIHDLPAMFTADVSLILRDSETATITEDSDIKPDFEISTLHKFFTLREVALYAVNLIKWNRRISYLSMFLLTPPAVMMTLENPPVQFSPAIAASGVTVTALLIFFNSLRMRRK